MSLPFLRWAGSKRKLIPVLREYWANREGAYVEPFAGSACLFFDLNPSKAILGDINADLIDTYRVIRTSPVEVYDHLSRMGNSATEYYGVRSLHPGSLSSTERAARFIYLNRYCFNGLYRTNQKGAFNVPYGGEKSGSLPTLTMLNRASAILTATELVSADFGTTLERVATGDFVYLDPPYTVKSRRVFNEYDALTFSEVDLDRLRYWLDLLTERGAEFLVSYAESSEAWRLSKGYTVRRLRVRRNIAGFTASRRLASELLISNVSILQRRN